MSEPYLRRGVAGGSEGNYIVITSIPAPPMRARLVRIGNSRGVRLPKPLIEEAGLGEEVELRVRGGVVEIAPAARPRSGWSEAARRMREAGESGLLDAAPSTRFDREEWRW